VEAVRDADHDAHSVLTALGAGSTALFPHFGVAQHLVAAIALAGRSTSATSGCAAPAPA
jgi:hypothetical protein